VGSSSTTRIVADDGEALSMRAPTMVFAHALYLAANGGGGACYRKIVCDINKLRGHFKKWVEFPRTAVDRRTLPVFRSPGGREPASCEPASPASMPTRTFHRTHGGLKRQKGQIAVVG